MHARVHEEHILELGGRDLLALVLEDLLFFFGEIDQRTVSPLNTSF
jgi:hypothetical protein